MTKVAAERDWKASAKFQVTKSQAILALIALVALLCLGFSTLSSSRATVSEAKVLSDVESPAASIIFTQRETLVYAVRLAQWSNGGASRRQVQISRSLLAQRLQVIDTSGKTMGSRAPSSYWRVLKESDQIVASAPAGILPENLHAKYDALISPITNSILAEARGFVVSYQRSFDQHMIDSTQANAHRQKQILFLFYIFLFFGGAFLILSVRKNFRNYQEVRRLIDLEQMQLDSTLEELKEVQNSFSELKRLDAAKDAFLSTVNHELRTPLTSIIGYLDFIRDEKLADSNPRLVGYLDVLDRNSQVLLNLVESVLSLSKIDAMGSNIVANQISLNQVVENSIFVLKPASEKEEINLIFSSSEEVLVDGDSAQLSQVFINLLANAIKFSPNSSDISIVLDTSQDDTGQNFARVKISDHGIGIPEEDLSHLFQRFFRAKNADSGQFVGTGLGLSIVDEVLKRHQGKISVVSQVNVGTTFTVEIPLFMSSEDKMIANRRKDVLMRAISSLEGASAGTFKDITHEIGGAIGFYGFEKLGGNVLALSRSLAGKEVSEPQFSEMKSDLLRKMNESLESINEHD